MLRLSCTGGGMRKLILIMIMVGLFILACSNQFELDDKSKVTVYTVFAGGEVCEGRSIHTYRIPSIVTSKEGTLLAFAEARLDSRSDRVPGWIVCSRSKTNGTIWCTPKKLFDPNMGDEQGTKTALNPTAVADVNTGSIFVFFNVKPFRDTFDEAGNLQVFDGYDYDNSYSLWVIQTEDEGDSWKSPINITETLKLESETSISVGPSRGICIRGGDDAGTLVVPGTATGGLHLFYSKDHGLSWQRSEKFIPEDGRTGEVMLVEQSDHSLLLMRRSKKSEENLYNYKYSVQSSDLGENWISVLDIDETDDQLGEVRDCGDSGCQAALLRYQDPLSDKSWILFSSPDYDQRTNLNLEMSDNNFQTRYNKIQLYSLATAYSCMTQAGNGEVGVLFEANKELETFSEGLKSLKESDSDNPMVLTGSGYLDILYLSVDLEKDDFMVK